MDCAFDAFARTRSGCRSSRCGRASTSAARCAPRRTPPRTSAGSSRKAGDEVLSVLVGLSARRRRPQSDQALRRRACDAAPNPRSSASTRQLRRPDGPRANQPRTHCIAMPRGFSKFAAAGFGTCLILLCVVFVAWRRGVSDRRPRSASMRRTRALLAQCARTNQLAGLLGDETPHPIGSAANMRVKARLVERLDRAGARAGSTGDDRLQLQVAGVRPRAKRARANRRTTAHPGFC